MLGITWTEATLALILILLRAKAAAFSPDNNLSAGIFGLRWDFIWVIMAMVTLSPIPTGLTKGLSLGTDICAHRAELHDRECRVWDWQPRKCPLPVRHRQGEFVELGRPNCGHPDPRRRTNCCHLSPAGHSKAYVTAYVSIWQKIDLLCGRPSRRHQCGRGHSDSAAMRPRPEAVEPDCARDLQLDQDMFAGGLSPRHDRRIRRSCTGLLSHLHLHPLAPGNAGKDWPVSDHGRWRNV